MKKKSRWSCSRFFKKKKKFFFSAERRKAYQNEKYFKKTERWAKIILATGIIFLIVTPFLFTRTSLLPIIDFSSTGQIGDTIGGITAPFIGLIGSVLVFLSFKAQTDMNRKQFEAIDKQFKRMKEEQKQAKYDHMQHVINVVNRQYIEDYKSFVFITQSQGLVRKLEIAESNGYLSEGSGGRMALTQVLYRFKNFDALLHLKSLIEHEKNNPNIHQLNFIKIQSGMILKNIRFSESYRKSIELIKTIRRKNPQLEQVLDRIEYYLKELNDLDMYCEENGIPDVMDFLDIPANADTHSGNNRTLFSKKFSV
jgi:hypothetical protein